MGRRHRASAGRSSSTNEEGIDWVNGPARPVPATEGAARPRQIGAVVAYDVKAEQVQDDLGHGPPEPREQRRGARLRQPVLLSGDDSFVSNPVQSQVYAYIADDADGVWNDSGRPVGVRPDDPAAMNDYYDFAVSSSMSVSGHYIKVPKQIATGQKADGSDMLAADVPASLGGPYLLPPADGSWQRGPGLSTGPGIDGPQWILEQWSDLNNVFQFVRIEDIATDKRPGMSNVVYLAD